MTDAAQSCTQVPSVGIFWRVPSNGGSVLITDATSLAEAEPYGTSLTHPRGHYEMWERWRELRPTDLARIGVPELVRYQEYEEFPRGRIVYDTSQDLFIIYADRQLHGPTIANQIIQAFGLGEQRTVIRSDPHYRTP